MYQCSIAETITIRTGVFSACNVGKSLLVHFWNRANFFIHWGNFLDRPVNCPKKYRLQISRHYINCKSLWDIQVQQFNQYNKYAHYSQERKEKFSKERTLTHQKNCHLVNEYLLSIEIIDNPLYLSLWHGSPKVSFYHLRKIPLRQNNHVTGVINKFNKQLIPFGVFLDLERAGLGVPIASFPRCSLQWQKNGHVLSASNTAPLALLSSLFSL